MSTREWIAAFIGGMAAMIYRRMTRPRCVDRAGRPLRVNDLVDIKADEVCGGQGRITKIHDGKALVKAGSWSAWCDPEEMDKLN